MSVPTTVRPPARNRDRRRVGPQPVHAPWSEQSGVRLLIGAYALFAVLMPPGRGPVMCPFRRITGHRCPLCGFTRATHALSRGRLKESLALHPLAVVAWPAYLGWLATTAPSLRTAVARRNPLRVQSSAPSHRPLKCSLRRARLPRLRIGRRRRRDEARQSF